MQPVDLDEAADVIQPVGHGAIPLAAGFVIVDVPDDFTSTQTRSISNADPNSARPKPRPRAAWSTMIHARRPMPRTD